ncbi:alpha/beta fold hydrolase [Streptomyces spiramenti]|uniref:Alpha/beta hydrolase n=1 Tax=Streptomyces spiramenti TaxID=2720606 RepID=A0ABX1AT65_9ACTN|nr:alpha/beta hydrolase [Streptomyces spiramenti]NJP67607.1 alpha/beta hydrolase [Streptomyces spiramenti]
MPDPVPAASSAWVTVQGIRTHYLRAGAGSQTVLLLHGGGIDRADFTWRDAVGPLAERFHVLVPDLPGYGETDKPDIDYTIDFYGDFVRDFMAELDVPRAHLVGLSMGGGIALNMALRHAELVDRLVPVNSYGLTHEIKSPLLTWVFTRVPPAHRYLYKQSGKSRDKIRSHFAGAVPGMTEDMVEEMYAMYQAPEAGKAFRSLNRSDVTPRGLRTDYSRRVDEIKAPTLFAHGAQDPVVPLDQGERAAARMENAQAYGIPGAGHFAPREQPEAFNDLVTRFLLGEQRPAGAGS